MVADSENQHPGSQSSVKYEQPKRKLSVCVSLIL